MYRSLGIVCLLIAAIAADAAELPKMPAPQRPAAAVAVNCNNGESVQAAVDASTAPVEIQITGICVESVLIRDKDVSLRGTQAPSLDGIRSPTDTPALTVYGAVIAEINDLSFSDSAETAVQIRSGARIAINNSRFENNGFVGLIADSGASVRGNGLTFRDNPDTNSIGIGATFFCDACDFIGGGAAAVSIRDGFVSLRDSAVTGVVGIVADEVGAFIDHDCASIETTHPCSMTVTGPAAIANIGSTAVLFGSGNFTGQLIADDRGTVRLNGAVQRLGSVDGAPNIVDNLGEIVVAPLTDPAMQSLILDTEAAHFARVLLTGNSVLGGSIQCSGAADAFLDPTVARVNGSTVTGCEHGGVR
jgi:hypothetical protein